VRVGEEAARGTTPGLLPLAAVPRQVPVAGWRDDADPAIATTNTQVEPLARLLFGEVPPTGRLPVSLPGPNGTGELGELGELGHDLRY